MLIYLDTCCFNRPYDNQISERIIKETDAKLYIQSRIATGHYRLATSYILEYETSRIPSDLRIMIINTFLHKYCSVYVPYKRRNSVENLARRIMQSGVKEKDALHVACALDAKCTYFLTTDDRLLRYKHQRITLLNPVKFI